MTHETLPVTSTQDGNRRTDTHPAFGLATVSRASGSPRTLFQSDLQHNETIRLTLLNAERGRELKHDWVFGTKEIIEVEMSLAQWGALVSSIGIGSGVPVTIRHTERVSIPDLPYEPRIAESVTETRGAVTELLKSARESFAAVNEAIDSKAGAKAVREAMRRHTSVLANAESNAAFAVSSLAEAAESVTSQAKADIESHILSATNLMGVASIEAPTFEVKQVES